MVHDPDRRSALIMRLADHILAHGLGAASLRPLAAAAGTSDRMLLYYFPDKAAIIAAVLNEIAQRMMTLLDANRASGPLAPTQLMVRLAPLIRDSSVWPFMQVWLEIASLAARGDNTCMRVGGGIARDFVAWLANQIDDADETKRQTEAVRLLMLIEGAVLLTSLGLGDAAQMAMTSHT